MEVKIMIFEPLLPWPLLVLVALGILGQLGWGFWRVFRSKTHKTQPPSRGYWCMCGLVLCLFGMAVGISLPGEKSPGGAVNLDVVFVIDRTSSISAEDYNGSSQRLDGVKHDALALIDKLIGARIGLITFDSNARVSVPLTSDSSATTTAIKTLDQERTLYSRGSSIDKPLATTKKVLEQSAKDYPERGRLVFYFGDGEQTTDTTPASFAPLKTVVDGGAVLGYGTATGGKMRDYYGSPIDGEDPSSFPYIIDYSHRDENNNFPDALSKIDEGNLQKIASAINIPYEHRTAPTQSLDSLIKKSAITIVGDSHRQVLHYLNLYWLFAAGAGLLLLWWGVDLLQLLRATRKETTA